MSSQETMDHLLRMQPYKGYVSPYCGMDTVVFRGPSGEEFRIDSREEHWMDDAWQKAKAEIDRRTEVDDGRR